MLDDLQLALAHYALQFPSLISLGVGNPPVTWKAEYDRVADSGLSATLVTNTASEGASVGGLKNFDQKVLLWALHYRRNQLDAAYVSPFEPMAPSVALTPQLGIRVRL